MTTWTSLTLAEASVALAQGDLSSLELVDACIAQAERVNPVLNAFLRVDAEQARDLARRADTARTNGKVLGPLHGIPLAHKDMFHRAGVRSSCGTVAGLPIPTTTATVLRRLDSAGAIQLGVLNMSGFALGPAGHNEALGHCRNPWNTQRVTGGSSSGSGAAVAARACFAALGSDTAGSIRIPAAMCGITGLKPTWSRVSRAGVMSLSTTLDTVGPMARSAEDCALMLDAIAGSDPADPTTAGDAPPSYHRALTGPLQGCRVGLPVGYFDVDVHPDVSAALQASLDVFRQLGCTVMPVRIPDLAVADVAAGLVCACEGAALHHVGLQEQPGVYGRHIRMRLERGFAVPAHLYINALRHRAQALAEFEAQVFSAVDVLHAPVLPGLTPAVAAPAGETADDVDRLLADLLRFTRPISYLGLPALALPIGMAGDGMPLSVQLIGRPFSEAQLLRLGHAFQRTTEFHRAEPTLGT